MPNDFDWIFERDPFWRERPKEEVLVVRGSHPPDARETRTSLRRSITSPLSSQHTDDRASRVQTSSEKGEEVTVSEMIEVHPQPTSLNRDALLRSIEECFDCAAACTSCADACLGEQDVHSLIRCIRLNHDCADACDAAGRILTRQTAPDIGVLRAAIQACAAACRACGEECERHADHHEHCRVCSRACRRCEQASKDLLAAIDVYRVDGL